jgi:cysteine synthase
MDTHETSHAEESGLGTDSRLRRYDDLREMIGDPENPTPIVALSRFLGPDSDAILYAKLEWMNPFGSVKDRAALWMLRAMAERGELEGKTVVEATSGNTGIALAAIAARMGVPMIATVPRSMPAEKAVLLRALGAEVVPTPEDAPAGRHPMDVAMDVAEEMVAESDEYVMPNQYDNPDNVLAHYESTGPEVWAQTEGRIRHFIAGFGTTGTVTGVGRYLKEQDPTVRIVAVEPVPGHKISGLKNLEETCVPGILDRSVIDEVVYVDDEETKRAAVRLHRQEGLMVGSSAAAILAGAARYLEGKSGVAVAIVPDSSQKAVSYLADALGE